MIIGGLLFVIGSTAFLYFGKSFNSVFVGLKKDMTLHGGQASIVQTSSQVEGTKNGNQLANTSQTLTYDTNGDLVNSSVPTQTVGSNGDLYGNQAHNNQNAPPTNENLTPKEQALIKNLSNSEHFAANLERSLQQLANYSGADTEKFKNTTILVNGTPMTTEQILLCLRLSGIVINLQNNQVQNSSINDNTASYVNQKANNVQNHTNAVGNATNDTLNNNGNPNTVGDTAKPTDTHQDASDTCTVGGYTDSGANCTGPVHAH